MVVNCDMAKRVAIIGGGASGFFSAITCAETNAALEITIFEKNTKFLSKVKVSGGGRCNVTNACFEPAALLRNYPRGGNFLKKVFSQFSTTDTVSWFEERGVKLKREADNRMFPDTDDSQTIIDCLRKESSRLGVISLTNAGISELKPVGNQFHLTINRQETEVFDYVIITTGGHNMIQGYQWLSFTGHTIIPPVPSLFTFNVPDFDMIGLAGVSVPSAIVKIKQSKLAFTGPLLVTHWGFSGPAVLKLSAWAAQELHGRNYATEFSIQWVSEFGEEACREQLNQFKNSNPKKIVIGHAALPIPSRLWEYLCQRAGIDHEIRWLDLPKKQLNKLIEELVRSAFQMKGKTTFKEEFVTCGGIETEEINPLTMESKLVKGLYFAGEIINVDGVTGGFNFQNAWSTGFIAGKAIGML